MKRILPILFAALALAGCLPAGDRPSSPPTQTPLPSATAVLAPGGASLTPTLQPFIVAVDTDVPIRSGPGIGYPEVGQVTAGGPVMLVGLDTNGRWWAILYDSSPTGYGWLPLDALTAPVPPDQLPVLSAEVVAPGSLAATGPGGTASPAPAVTPETPSTVPTPTAVTPTPSAPYGTVLVEIHVREKPAQNFASLGTLQPGTFVVLTGRTLSGYWYRVEFAAGPNGFGWAAAAYVSTTNEIINALPYYDNLGEPVNQP